MKTEAMPSIEHMCILKSEKEPNWASILTYVHLILLPALWGCIWSKANIDEI